MNSDAAAPPALLLVAEPRLREEVRRIAAAADRRLDERALPIGRHTWLGAALVLLDTSAARACAGTSCARRPGVILVTEGEPGLLDWQTATAIGAEQVLALPDSAESLIAAFAAHTRRGTGNGVVIAVAGACGGAGASTLAASIALTAASHHFRQRTLLLDAAPFGGGLDLLLGIEKTPGLRWPDLVIEQGRVAAEALHEALPAVHGVTVLACARTAPTPTLPAPAVRAVLESARTAGDLLICDLSTDHGPHADQILDAADLVVLITPATLRATAAAEPITTQLRHRNPNVALIVRGPSPGGLRPTDIAAALDLPLLHTMRPQPGLTRRLEHAGLTLRRHTPLHRAAESVLAVLTPPSGPRSVVSPSPARHSDTGRRTARSLPHCPDMTTCATTTCQRGASDDRKPSQRGDEGSVGHAERTGVPTCSGEAVDLSATNRVVPVLNPTKRSDVDSRAQSATGPLMEPVGARAGVRR